MFRTVAAFICTLPAMAATVALDFNTLPSTQGWSFSTGSACPFTESQLYTATGGVLHQSTLPCDGDDGVAFYQMDGAISPGTYSLAFTARVTADTSFYAGSVSHFGMGAGAIAFGEEYFFGLGPGVILGIDGSTGGYAGRVLSNSVDTTLFHNYLVHVTPGSGYTLWVDGSLIASGSPYSVPAGDNMLLLGDDASRANAAGDWTAFEYSSVPEPGSFCLAAAGLVLAVLRVRGIGLFRPKFPPSSRN